MNFHLENKCNFKCKYCYAHFDYNEEDKKLSLDQCKKIIDSTAQAGFKKINFAGGEPFLHPNLGELVEHSFKNNLKTSIITNGSKITKQWLNNYG